MNIGFGDCNSELPCKFAPGFGGWTGAMTKGASIDEIHMPPW
jgi:hypothetical protein